MANQPAFLERPFLRRSAADRRLSVGRFPRRRMTAAFIAGLMVAGLTATGLALWAPSVRAAAPMPQLDTDEFLKPLVDSQAPQSPAGSAEIDAHRFARPETGNLSPLQSNALSQDTATSQGSGAAPLSGNGQTLVLTGKIQTLQEAIASEKDVDWYVWYLGARTYLSAGGGLQCALGTPIKFYRDGRIEAMTFDSICRASVANRLFPLPKKSRLDALILPVRNGQAPPASPQELYSRINALKTQ